MKTPTLVLLALGAIANLSGAAWGEQHASTAALPVVRLETTLGNIDMELYPKYAPVTVENFLRLVDSGFYDGLIFHRVIANFMIQTGGYDAQMKYRQEPGTIVNESFNGLLNRKQYVAMARMSEPDSAGAQFFINVRTNPHLDAGPGKPGYTVFGKVIGGWDVVEEIELSDTSVRDGMAAVPDTPIVITHAERVSAPSGGG